MSYTNETTYYGLPLPTGSDKSTFTDNNTAFEAVDAALHTAAEQSGAAAEDIVAIKADIVDLKAADVTMSGDIDAAEINIEALQQKELLQDAAIDAVKADAFDMITAYNEPTATSTHAYSVGDYFIYNDVLYKATDSIAIGDTIVPDTNCATTNVTSELATLRGVEVCTASANLTYAQQLTALQTAYSNLNSNQKVNCYLLDSNSIVKADSRTGEFTIINTSSDTVYVSTYNIVNATVTRCQITTSGAVFIDRSSVLNTHELHLFCDV